jgi:hypothetical protein
MPVRSAPIFSANLNSIASRETVRPKLALLPEHHSPTARSVNYLAAIATCTGSVFGG